MATSASSTAVPTGTWSIDPAHSQVAFTVKHLGIATVRGAFNTFEGTLEVTDAGVKAFGTVDAASVHTNEAQRDEHLRSADFFDAEQFPQLTFQSKEIRTIDDETFEIVGDLTMHGVTNEVTFKAEVQGTEQDPWGNDRVALEVTGQLKRGDYGMTFNQALGSGNMLVSDKVKLALDLSAIKQA
jgi:polyisoprenoid-binding protein YceI